MVLCASVLLCVSMNKFNVQIHESSDAKVRTRHRNCERRKGHCSQATIDALAQLEKVASVMGKIIKHVASASFSADEVMALMPTAALRLHLRVRQTGVAVWWTQSVTLRNASIEAHCVCLVKFGLRLVAAHALTKPSMSVF